MTNEQWNTTLYKQMFTEQEQFRTTPMSMSCGKTFCFRSSTTT